MKNKENKMIIIKSSMSQILLKVFIFLQLIQIYEFKGVDTNITIRTTLQRVWFLKVKK
jgi:hypothetical protein